MIAETEHSHRQDNSDEERHEKIKTTINTDIYHEKTI
jgi:hypothetical protein